jgi:hypothetical protein
LVGIEEEDVGNKLTGDTTGMVKAEQVMRLGEVPDVVRLDRDFQLIETRLIIHISELDGPYHLLR